MIFCSQNQVWKCKVRRKGFCTFATIKKIIICTGNTRLLYFYSSNRSFTLSIIVTVVKVVVEAVWGVHFQEIIIEWTGRLLYIVRKLKNWKGATEKSIYLICQMWFEKSESWLRVCIAAKAETTSFFVWVLLSFENILTFSFIASLFNWIVHGTTCRRSIFMCIVCSYSSQYSQY